MNVHDRDLILSTLLGSSIVYVILSILLTNKLIPTLTAVYIVANMIPSLRGFDSFMGKLRQFNWNLSSRVRGASNKLTNETTQLNDATDRKFSLLSQTKRVEVMSSIKSLQLYAANGKKTNAKRRRLFKLMSWRQQNLCKKIGYLDKLDTLDHLISKNQLVLNRIVELFIKDYNINFSDFDLIKNFNDNNSYRVIESVSHFTRDWPSTNASLTDTSFELSPILHFINNNLQSIIPSDQKQNTCILVPGSGLGRIPHELANDNYGHVHSIEFSGLMYLFNKFVYSNNDISISDLELYPYIHSNSNFQSLNHQYRSQLIPQLRQPANLSMHLEDFNLFDIPTDHIASYDNIVIVTAFFIDTAENLVDYLDTIYEFTKPFKNGYWINIGPLKYGTAPQVELNVEELAQLRKDMGWIDLNTINTLQKPIFGASDLGVYSYVTDKESLWQGYYGLSGWCSKRNK